MNVTLFAALATAAMDPILIFGLHLGLPGAAISTVLSRCVLATLGWLEAARRHDLVGRPSLRALGGDMVGILHVALPAMLTNLATPVGAAYVTRASGRPRSRRGGRQATIDRVSPVAFGFDIRVERCRRARYSRRMRVPDGLTACARPACDSFSFVLATVLAAWAILASAQELVVRAFFAHGLSAELVHLFCSWLAAGSPSPARCLSQMLPSTISAIQCFPHCSTGAVPASGRSHS